MFINQNHFEDRRVKNKAQDSFAVSRRLINNYLSQRHDRPQPDMHRGFTSVDFSAENLKEKIVDGNRKSTVQKRIHDIYSKVKGNKLLTDTHEDEFVDDFYYAKFYKFELVNALFSIISIISAVAHYELSYYVTDDRALNKYSILLYFCTFLTFMLWINLFLYECMILEYKKKKQHLMESDTIISSGQYKKLIYLFLLTFLHPNPIFERKTYFSYNHRTGKDIERSINAVLTNVLLKRFYLVIRYIVYFTNYMSPDTDRICQKFSFNANIKFSIKSLIIHMPFKMYIIIGLISVFSFSFSIRVFERGLYQYTDTDNFNNFFNTIWYVLITMTTVGYGDFNVMTNEGRVIAMCSCIFGSFLISLLLLTLANFLNHTKNELTMYRILERAELNNQNERKAKKVISNFGFALLKLKRGFRGLIKTQDYSMKGLMDSVNQFQGTSNLLTINDNQQAFVHPYTALQTGITFMEKEYKKIVQSDNRINNQLHQMKEKLERIYLELNTKYI